MLLGRRGRVRLRIRAMLVGKGNLVGLRIRAVLLGRGDLVGLRIRATCWCGERPGEIPPPSKVCMVFDLYRCMCYSNHNINITKRFYGHENIVFEYYLVTEDKNSNFQDCMRIAALRKQLFARLLKTN